jgi:1,4-alpha-glucan branching enzyme
MVVGFPLDSANLREIRVWAPGAKNVDLVADFVDWIPVPLIRQPNGEWRGYYRVAPGLHRFNLLLDWRDYDVPSNQRKVDDGFGGSVGLILVR